VAVKTIHLELLLGRRVLDGEGKSIGRIEEIRAESKGDDFVVTEYHVGPPAMLERLSASAIGGAILEFLRLRDRGKGRLIPWDKLDVTDPAGLRLLCSSSELAVLDKQR
jgi:sporulation protein YlmC with PRC-barrel domain